MADTLFIPNIVQTHPAFNLFDKCVFLNLLELQHFEMKVEPASLPNLVAKLNKTLTRQEKKAGGIKPRQKVTRQRVAQSLKKFEDMYIIQKITTEDDLHHIDDRTINPLPSQDE